MSLPSWLNDQEATCNAGDMQETQVQFLGWEDPLESEMAIYSSILAWEIPWAEEPGGLQSRGRKELVMTEQHNNNNAACYSIVSSLSFLSPQFKI